jgi:hypothetical protein
MSINGVHGDCRARKSTATTPRAPPLPSALLQATRRARANSGNTVLTLGQSHRPTQYFTGKHPRHSRLLIAATCAHGVTMVLHYYAILEKAQEEECTNEECHIHFAHNDSDRQSYSTPTQPTLYGRRGDRWRETPNQRRSVVSHDRTTQLTQPRTNNHG